MREDAIGVQTHVGVLPTLASVTSRAYGGLSDDATADRGLMPAQISLGPFADA